jgi:hypothetical protein
MATANERHPVALSQECFMTFRNVLKHGMSEIIAHYTLVANLNFALCRDR